MTEDREKCHGLSPSSAIYHRLTINDFDCSPPVLFFDSEIDSPPKLDAERIEVGVGAVDGRPVFPVQEGDFDSGQPERIREQIPCRCTISRKRPA